MERNQFLAMAEAQRAEARAAANPGLGELQALREIQAERLMQARIKRAVRSNRYD